jgi:hypothetical protein
MGLFLFMAKTDARENMEQEKSGEPTTQPTGGEAGQTGTTGQRTFTEAEYQAEVERRVTEAVRTNSEKVKAEFKLDAENKQREAEETRLRESGEFKTLLEQREGELAEARKTLEELTHYKAQADSAGQVLTAYADAEIKALGLDKQEPIIELLSGKSPQEKIEWLTKHRASFSKAATGLPGTPGDTKSATVTDDERRKAAITPRQYLRR